MAKYRYEGAYPATVTLPDGSTEVVKPGEVVELGKAPTGRNWQPASGHHQQRTDVAGVLAEVGDDAEKATEALAAEKDAPRPRKGLIEQLEAIIAAAAAATSGEQNDPGADNAGETSATE